MCLLLSDFAVPAVSQDGHWIAYEGDGAEGRQTYVRPYPDLGQRIAVGGENGRHARWSRDGRRLFYLTYKPSGEAVMTAVDVDLSRGFSAGAARVVWSGATADYVGGTDVHPYELAKDGRTLAIRLDPQVAAPARTINIVR